MAIQIKAQLQKIGFNPDAAPVFVLRPDYYNRLSEKKVLKEAAIRSGISEGVIKAAWYAAGEVIKAWATEGHSVAVPGLGSMRFSVNAKMVNDVNNVRVELINRRKIIFYPNTEIKQELEITPVQITCYDEDGKEIKRVVSSDAGNVDSGNGSDSGGVIL
ncbi:MAG: DNA-binding protein [Prevotellaceae bacterium]|nr:DNA-binding protein [Prevotellaceae bacterium]MDY6200266.1 DNA-binding protein [Prevotella sp.]